MDKPIKRYITDGLFRVYVYQCPKCGHCGKWYVEEKEIITKNGVKKKIITKMKCPNCGEVYNMTEGM